MECSIELSAFGRRIEVGFVLAATWPLVSLVKLLVGFRRWPYVGLLL
jgi:hypothetical protein